MNDFAAKTLSAGARLKQIKNELNNFKGTEQQFLALNKEAAKLTDQINNTNQRIKVLASSTKNIEALSSAFAGLTGIFTAIQGAQALFGKESENVQRALVKLQGSLALLQGVQAAVATVTEQSAAKTVLMEKAQKAYNLVVGNSTGALKGFKIALAATGIGLAVIAIAALVTNWDKLKGAITGVSKEQEDFNKAKAEGFKNYADEATQVDILITKYKDENTTKEERINILNKLNEISPNYFKTLDAEKVNVDELTESYKKYLKALENKGAIEVLAKQLSDLRVQKLELEASFTEVVKEDDGTLRRIAGTQQNINALQRLDRQMEAIRKQIIAINNEQGILGGDPIDAEEIIPEGTIKDLERKIAKLREQINITDPNSSDFLNLDKQADALEIQLEEIKRRLENKKIKVGDIIEFDPNKADDPIKHYFDESLKALDEFAKKFREADIRPQINSKGFDQLRDQLLEEDKETAKLRKDLATSLETELANSIQSAYDTIFQIAAQSRDERLQQEIETLDKRKEFELSAANLTAYEKILIEEKFQRLQTDAKIKAFKADQQAAIAQAAINGALGATKTIANLGFPLAIPALLAEATAVLTQIALIKAQKPPEFAEGVIDLHQPGEIKGKDSIHAKLMPGESVITTKATQQYKPELTAIQSGNLEDLIKVKYIEPALTLKALETVKTDSQVIKDYSERFYRQLLETKDTNHILKRIDTKLNKDADRALLLKLKRQF